jgi:hypothetical protein
MCEQKHVANVLKELVKVAKFQTTSEALID